MNLEQFLNNNKVIGKTTKVPISNRLRNPETKELYMATISVVDADDYAKLQNETMDLNIKDKKVKINTDLMNTKLILNYCKYPNFKKEENIKAAKCITPEEYLKSVLLPGEIINLANQIREFSGINEDIDELKDEVKNY